MARLDDRGGRDAAGFGPYHRPEADLVPLRELGDWQLAKGEPDIRGWEVRTVSGRSIGTVRDLLIDPQSREAVLLDLDLADGERRGRAPLRAAQIDRVARVVRMDSADLLGGSAAAVEETSRERVVDRPVTAAGDLPDRSEDRLDRDERLDHERDVRRLEDADRDGTRDRLAESRLDETVVERRPVVYEEVVVRRRNVDEDVSDVGRDQHTDDRTGDRTV